MRHRHIRTREVHVGRYRRRSPRGRLHSVDPHTRSGRPLGRRKRRRRDGTHYTVRDEQGYFRGSLIT